MADITIVNWVYKPTYNWGAPSCRGWDGFRSVQFISSEGFPLWLFNSSPWEMDGLPNFKMVDLSMANCES